MPEAAGIVTGEAVGVNRYFGSLLKVDKMHDPRSHFEDAIADPAVFLDTPEELSRYGRDWTGRFQGETPLVLRPNSTEQVQALLAVCHRKGRRSRGS